MQEPQHKKHKHKKSSFPFLVRDDTGVVRKNTGFESDSSSVEITSPIRSDNAMPPPPVPLVQSKKRSSRSLIAPSDPPLSSTLLQHESETPSRSIQNHKQSLNLPTLNNTFPSLSEDNLSGLFERTPNKTRTSLFEASKFDMSEGNEKNDTQSKKRQRKTDQLQSTLQLMPRFNTCVANAFDFAESTVNLPSDFIDALAHPQAQCSLLFAPTEVMSDPKLLAELSQQPLPTSFVLGEDVRYRLDSMACRPARYLVVARDSEADSWRTLAPRIDTALLLTRAPDARRLRSPRKSHRAHVSSRPSRGDAVSVASAAERTANEPTGMSSARSVTSFISRASSGFASVASSALRSTLSETRAPTSVAKSISSHKR